MMLGYLERKCPKTKFNRGIVIAACIHLGCDWSHNDHFDYKNAHGLPSHKGWTIIPPYMIKKGGNNATS
jgi:hypothetical protein